MPTYANHTLHPTLTFRGLLQGSLGCMAGLERLVFLLERRAVVVLLPRHGLVMVVDGRTEEDFLGGQSSRI